MERMELGRDGRMELVTSHLSQFCFEPGFNLSDSFACLITCDPDETIPLHCIHYTSIKVTFQAFNLSLHLYV